MKNDSNKIITMKTNVLTMLKECARGHIEITQSAKSFHIYITNNDFCFRSFFSYVISTEELADYTSYQLTNKILAKYKQFLMEKAFY